MPKYIKSAALDAMYQRGLKQQKLRKQKREDNKAENEFDEHFFKKKN